MKMIKILTTFAFLGSLCWLITQPGWEPGIAVVFSLIALIAEFTVKKKSKVQPQQKQTVTGNSTGFQAGGNINISTNKKDDDVR
jgi:hypothetical protein